MVITFCVVLYLIMGNLFYYIHEDDNSTVIIINGLFGSHVSCVVFILFLRLDVYDSKDDFHTTPIKFQIDFLDLHSSLKKVPALRSNIMCIQCPELYL